MDSDSKMRPEVACVLPALQPSCYDALYRTVTDSAYGWFAFTMLLKLAVNLIFLAGQFFPGQFEWGLWLQILLIFSALLSHRVEPYVSQGDNFMEQVAFLLLACVLSIVNSSEQDTTTIADQLQPQCVSKFPEDNALCAAVSQLNDASECEKIVKVAQSANETLSANETRACTYIAAGDVDDIEIPYKDLSCAMPCHSILTCSFAFLLAGASSRS